MHFGRTAPATREKMTGPEVWFPSITMQVVQWETFLYRRIAGIEATEGGYRSFRIQPLTGGNLKWAKGSVNTAYGTVSSEWKIEDGMFTIQVQVPVGTTCTLVMPGNTQKVLGSGTYTLKRSNQGKE